MPETLDDLRAALRSRADETVVPAPPFGPIGDLATARTRRRRRAVALVAAAAVTVGVLTAVGIDRGRQTGSDRPPLNSPSGLPTPSQVPEQELADGEIPQIAYVDGATLHYRARFEPVPGGATALRQGGDTVMFLQAEDRLRVLRIDPERGTLEDLLNEQTPTPGALDPTGRYAAWQDPAQGPAQVVFRRLEGGGELRATFPGAPSCCDNPFLVSGVTTDGKVYASLPALSKTWVWDALGDGSIQEVTGLGNPQARIVQVVGDRVVVEKADGVRALGSVDDAHWREIPANEGSDLQPIFDGYAAWSASGRRVLFLQDDDVQIFDEDHVGNFEGGVEMISMNLPPGRVFPDFRFEDEKHALLRFLPAGAIDPLIVRCTVSGRGLGNCEEAASTSADAELPD